MRKNIAVGEHVHQRLGVVAKRGKPDAPPIALGEVVAILSYVTDAEFDVLADRALSVRDRADVRKCVRLGAPQSADESDADYASRMAAESRRGAAELRQMAERRADLTVVAARYEARAVEQ